MDVIKDGEIGNLEDWETEITCDKKNGGDDKEGCGAVLSVNAKDPIMMWWHGTHFKHWYAAVRCPQCGKYNQVKLPDLLWEQFNTTKNKKNATFDGFKDSIY